MIDRRSFLAGAAAAAITPPPSGVSFTAKSPHWTPRNVAIVMQPGEFIYQIGDPSMHGFTASGLTLNGTPLYFDTYLSDD